MQRRILGYCAIALLAGAVAIGHWHPEAEMVLSFCWRMGAIFAAAWLAYDTVQRLPNWLLIAVPVLLVVLWRSSRLLLLLIPALVAWAFVRRFLWPGNRSRGANR